LKEENEEEQHEVCAAVVLECFVSRAVPAKIPSVALPIVSKLRHYQHRKEAGVKSAQ
jgi:hypothetical protein